MSSSTLTSFLLLANFCINVALRGSPPPLECLIVIFSKILSRSVSLERFRSIVTLSRSIETLPSSISLELSRSIDRGFPPRLLLFISSIDTATVGAFCIGVGMLLIGAAMLLIGAGMLLIGVGMLLIEAGPSKSCIGNESLCISGTEKGGTGGAPGGGGGGGTLLNERRIRDPCGIGGGGGPLPTGGVGDPLVSGGGDTDLYFIIDSPPLTILNLLASLAGIDDDRTGDGEGFCGATDCACELLLPRD